ncbi:PcfJ domain-containing protein [Pararhizobium sp. BT-229]|uniref:PcfJ domain-containing protein n=1 Tax=Pararhizobium sp. BT-229 TaxID=2986923 RepID=UPI0021F74CA8|nr:PcfJ domain-containing protein [Pararhizobium sp. BT-229]MCV9963624.1 PcfJ domain-containing protein [Pararhizobium sp. BT-229]
MDKEIIKSFQARIDDFLKGQVEWIERGRPRLPDSPDMLPLLQMSAGRVLLKSAIRRESVMKAIIEASMDETRHIYDWLLASSLRKEPWLSRCDDHGRPLKLMKFGTYQQIIAEANKAMAKRRGDGFRVAAGEGAKVIHECCDGWTVVRLKTPEALDHEGYAMGHCVGQGSYDGGLSTNFTGIYSLRDPFGRSHVTLEIDHSMDIVRQIKGKQNRPPKAEYMRRLLGWRGLKDVSVEGTELPSGFGVEKSRGIVELSSLKPGDVFDGNIGIVLKDNADFVLDVPAGVTIRGTVVIQGHKSFKLFEVGDNVDQLRWAKVSMPDGVFFDGDVRLDHVTLERFSFAGRRLVVRNAAVRSFGDIRCDVTQFAATEFSPIALDGASFKGSVEMQDCRGVVFLASTSVGAHVSVAGCRPRGNQAEPELSFAEGFEVKRKLNIFNSMVRMGDRLHVDGNADIRESTVTCMPSHLSVTGSLNVADCLIDRWPETLDVQGTLSERSVELCAPPTPIGAIRRMAL